VPADAGPLSLSFWYLPGTEAAATTSVSRLSWEGYRPVAPLPQRSDAAILAADLWSSYDWQRVLILDANYVVDRTILTNPSTPTPSGGHVTVPLDDYRRTIVI
jgi:hypothetical protein